MDRECLDHAASKKQEQIVPREVIRAQVSAAGALLDRGWGKPAQSHTGEDDKDIRITIRQIVEGGDKD